MPNLLKQWWVKGQRLTANMVNAMAAWINDFEVTPPLYAERTRTSVRVHLLDEFSRPVVPVQITGTHADSPAGYLVYLGSAYADGPGQAATATAVTVMLDYVPGAGEAAEVLKTGQVVLAARFGGGTWEGVADSHAEDVYYCQYDWNRALWVTIGDYVSGSRFECVVAAVNNWSAPFNALIDLEDYDSHISGTHYAGAQVLAWMHEWDEVASKEVLRGRAHILPHQVKVSEDDELPERLEDKIVAGEGVAVDVLNDGSIEDLRIGLDVDSLDALGTIDPDADWVPIYDTDQGTHAKVTPDVLHNQATDAFKVKGDTSDTVPDYLHDKCQDHGNKAAEDVLVYAEVVNNSGNRKVRWFADDADLNTWIEQYFGTEYDADSAIGTVINNYLENVYGTLSGTPAYVLAMDSDGNVGWKIAGPCSS